MSTESLALDALEQRLAAIAPVLGVSTPDDDVDVRARVDALLSTLVDDIASDLSEDRLWLLQTAIAGAFPTVDDVMAMRRSFELDRPEHLIMRLLGDAVATMTRLGTARRRLEMVTDHVLVDVDFSAKDDLHTGIQRVVRNVAPRWDRDHDARLVVWTAGAGAYRDPTEAERVRVTKWGSRIPLHIDPSPWDPILVPWRTKVVLLEVPGQEQIAPLVAMSRFSGNEVSCIGYDCIPLTSADLVAPSDAQRFTRYLTLIKHLDTLVAISDAVAHEFSGFVRALAAQGLDGPVVETCPLGVDAHDDDGERRPTAVPQVVVIGSVDRRKNQAAVLYASEVLWRDGHRFSLRLLGHPGFGTQALTDEVERLQELGRPVEIEHSLPDEDIWDAYRAARFTVFVSLQEGFGLPIVESLSFGTPVITTEYGSTAEIAAGGGTVLVDPRNDDELVDAMRSLLADDERYETLASEARQRRFPSWDDYATSLWHVVGDPA